MGRYIKMSVICKLLLFFFLHKIKFIAHTGKNNIIPHGEGLRFHPEQSKRKVGWSTMAFIWARAWGRPCFSQFELPIGAKGGSPETFLRASPEVGLEGMALDGCQSNIEKRVSLLITAS